MLGCGSQIGLGEESERRRLGFVDRSWERESLLALMIMALYRQAEIYK